MNRRLALLSLTLSYLPAANARGRRGGRGGRGGSSGNFGALLVIGGGAFYGVWWAFKKLSDAYTKIFPLRPDKTQAFPVDNAISSHVHVEAEPSPPPRFQHYSDPARCPLCGKNMVMRTAKKGRNRGSSFLGCSSFPSCRGTRSQPS